MTLEKLAKARNIERDKVWAWVGREAAKGNIRTHEESPYWIQYLAAEKAFCDAAALPRC